MILSPISTHYLMYTYFFGIQKIYLWATFVARSMMAFHGEFKYEATDNIVNIHDNIVSILSK